MQCNVGNTDRTIRIVLGIIILAVGLIVGRWWGLLGMIPLVTGLAQWRPLYAKFKISSRHEPLRA